MVDMNIVMTGAGEFVELQGTGEEATFTASQLQEMLAVAETGMKELMNIQRTALGDIATLIKSEAGSHIK